MIQAIFTPIAFLKKNPILCTLVLLLVSIALFLSLNVLDWQFALQLRTKKLVALMLVGFAVATSTLLFQTLTHNPILTPALLGFDSLYVLIKSLLVFFLGVVSLYRIPSLVIFASEVAVMIAASMLLFHFLFSKSAQDLTKLILVGVVFGVFFKSLSSLIARLINPNDFVIVQSASFAQFNTVDKNMLIVATVINIICAFIIWRMRFVLDVLLLGKYPAINLGINYHKASKLILIIIAVLVSVSIALSGPITFFGLLVCALTNQITTSMHHARRLILATLIACVCLILGQTIFEHLLNMAGVLSVVIEFIGGLAFLLLIFRQYKNSTI